MFLSVKKSLQHGKRCDMGQHVTELSTNLMKYYVNSFGNWYRERKNAETFCDFCQ